MAMDLKKSFASVVLEKPIATGVLISTEGQLLARVVESGVEKVRPAAAAGSEVIVGFSMTNNEQPSTTPVIDSVTAPVILTTGTVQLSHAALVGTSPTVEIRITDVTAALDLTQVAGAPAANQFSVDPLTGIVTLHSVQSTHALTVYYRRNLTVVESQQLFFQPNVNNTATNVLGLVGVYMGKGQVFTMEYDAAQDYSGAAPALKTGALGKITIGGAGTAITNMRVVKAPSASDLSLGLEFNI